MVGVWGRYMFFPDRVSDSTSPLPDVSDDVHDKSSDEDGKAGRAIPPTKKIEGNPQEELKSTWWPNCVHSRFSKLAQRKFRDRLVILWKCRRCPKQIREIIDIDMNSREVFVKSTKSALPRRYDNDPPA